MNKSTLVHSFYSLKFNVNAKITSLTYKKHRALNFPIRNKITHIKLNLLSFHAGVHYWIRNTIEKGNYPLERVSVLSVLLTNADLGIGTQLIVELPQCSVHLQTLTLSILSQCVNLNIHRLQQSLSPK